MAKTLQHFLPRFLLKGFASRRKGPESFIWVSRKGGRIFEANVKNVAASKGFYDSEKNPGVDDELQKLESVCGPLFDELRSSTTSRIVEEPSVVDHLANFWVRTQNMRRMSEDFGTKLTNFFLDELANPNTARSAARSAQESDSELLGRVFDENTRKSFKINRRAYKQRRRDFLRFAPDYLERSAHRAPEVAASLGNPLLGVLESATKEGQLNCLLQSVKSEPETKQARKGNWFLVVTSGEPLVIGDCGLYHPFMDEDDIATQMVFLPISRNHLILGTTGDSPPEVSPERLNQLSAGRSVEFIAGPEKNLAKRYAPFIGKRAQFLSDERFEELFREALSELWG